jgi:carboxylesterase type B
VHADGRIYADGHRHARRKRRDDLLHELMRRARYAHVVPIASKRTHAAFLALAAVVAVACGTNDAAREGARTPNAEEANGSDVVRVDTGMLRGARAGATMSFKGIPYAAAPIGPRRWQPPSPATPWTDVRDATHFGDGCVEIELPSGKVKQGSEDCLTLNVWTPMPRPNDRGESKLPVLVYLHGGFNVYGSSRKTVEDQLLYDGESIAARGNAVVVTLNYRLGALGFLASRALGTHGNFALLDQIAALQWVKKNISMFGGDPSHVMLFGHSAGAVDACALVASPRAKGCFPARSCTPEIASRRRRRRRSTRETRSPRSSAAIKATRLHACATKTRTPSPRLSRRATPREGSIGAPSSTATSSRIKCGR